MRGDEVLGREGMAERVGFDLLGLCQLSSTLFSQC